MNKIVKAIQNFFQEHRNYKERIRIEKTNLQFQLASLAEKRVIIAKEVLLRLATEKIVASTGSYFRPHQSNWKINHSDVKLKELVNSEQCNVCAIGGGFLALIGLTNNCTLKQTTEEGIQDIITQEFVWNFLKDYFTKEQLILMEAAFESRIGIFSERDKDSWSNEFYNLVVKAKEMYNVFHTSATDRMIAIWQNVIDNKGNFVV